MKKLNVKLFTALLAVALVASASIFYACKKENDNNSDKSLKKEAEFVARIHENLCVQVDVFRDEHNNVHIMTKETDNDPEIITGMIIPNAINIKPQNAKNEEEEVFIEIPNDAIHWLVLLDGNEPEKVPTGGTGPYMKVFCGCSKGKPNCFHTGLNCKKPVESGSGFNYRIYCPAPDAYSCCQTCVLKYSISAETGGSGTSMAMGSIYIVQSNTITINGITYE
ncbi:MAG: hypothetical protein FWD09_05615 [Lentimicrobiaceae bacterium]|nr:hypothetical protein [Lentimicrobiaceae bacterium]